MSITVFTGHTVLFFRVSEAPRKGREGEGGWECGPLALRLSLRGSDRPGAPRLRIKKDPGSAWAAGSVYVF